MRQKSKPKKADIHQASQSQAVLAFTPSANDRVEGVPIIPLRDTILFPGNVSPLLLGRPGSLSAMFKALEHSDKIVFLSLQLNSIEEEITADSLHKTGVLARIISSTPSPNNLSKILIEVIAVAQAEQITDTGGFLLARVKVVPSTSHNKGQLQIEDIMELFGQYLHSHPDLPLEVLKIIKHQKSPEDKIHAIAGQLQLAAHLKQMVLEEPTLSKKSQILRELIKNDLDMNVLSRRLEHEVHSSISRSQKEYFLTEQLKKIQLELGQNSPIINQEVRKLSEEVQARGMPPPIEKKVQTEIKRLAHLHSTSPEYSVVRNYVDWFLNIPWGQLTEDCLNLRAVKRQLDADHFALTDVKDRILEHVSIYRLSKGHKSPILCLVGPPGVGKTSLGSSIAMALGRKFARISLGGVRDEAEIRGHRRTYIGSMPGKIIQTLRKCNSMNPVILLDETDKMGGDFRGDPASALLEVLDPEQNFDFTDNFMETGIDLSQILFITTANVEANIPEPLKDRLEVIRISGYYNPEKLQIAKLFLIPKIRKASGLSPAQFKLSDSIINTLILQYTHEAGVRNLEKALAKIARKRARQVVQGRNHSGALNLKAIRNFMGAPIRKEVTVPKSYPPGVITGLAWTPSGGEILQVECKLISGTGKLHLTGKLGDVMKESAQIALTLVRERGPKFNIEMECFNKTDIHLHFPEGAIPKDGPSAGVSITLCILGAFLKKPVLPTYAFSGEISLTGEIHAVGGLPEKTLAALQAGVSQVFLPADNHHDIAELPSQARRGLVIKRVKHIDTLIKLLFN